jgi:hypothetical protein
MLRRRLLEERRLLGGDERLLKRKLLECIDEGRFNRARYIINLIEEKKDKKWIQKAIKNKGSLRALAQREGAITKRGTISRKWLEKKAKEGGKVGRRARLALTLRKFK